MLRSRFHTSTLLLVCAVVPALAGAQVRTAPTIKGSDFPAVDSVRLLTDLQTLSSDEMDGRRLDTSGNVRARAYILRQFLDIGVDPVTQRFTHAFSTTKNGTTLQGTNIMGMIRGTKHPDRYIVLTAHFDHLGNRNGTVFNGADDNASGVSGVLAIARWLHKSPPENSVMFVLFDGEEAGLAGSSAFVQHAPVALERFAANVNLDMIGRNAKGELWAAGATPWPVMRPLLDALAVRAPIKLRQGHDAGTGQANWIQQSDQGPFHAAGIPFVYFGVEDHPDYHKPTDKFARIEPGFLVSNVRTIAEFVHQLDSSLDVVMAARQRGPARP